MKFPSKLYTYEESSISKFPIILKLISAESYTIEDLYDLTKDQVGGITEFLHIMDCLYALGKIDINEEGEISYAAKRDKV